MPSRSCSWAPRISRCRRWPRSSAAATRSWRSIPARRRPPAAAWPCGPRRSSVAEKFGLPVLTPTSLRTEEAAETFRNHAADVAVVVAYGMILPPAILDAPALGCLNLHASLLPRWRGAAPIQRAVMAGDDDTGVAVMRMEPGLDTGPVGMVERCGHRPRHDGRRAARPADAARRRPDGAGARRARARQPAVPGARAGGASSTPTRSPTRKRGSTGRKEPRRSTTGCVACRRSRAPT